MHSTSSGAGSLHRMLREGQGMEDVALVVIVGIITIIELIMII